MTPILPPKVYSYVRFSTPDQIKGDSQRRQVEMARNWANSNGYELDESLTIEDYGKSAYKGDHLKTGNLGRFLERCHDGDVPRGSILLVEAFDRLTRLPRTEALTLLLELIKYVDLVVLRIGQDVINADKINKDPSLIWQIVAAIELATTESSQKSSRGKSTWEEKRRKANNDYLITERTPAWIQILPLSEKSNSESSSDEFPSLIKRRSHKEKCEDVEVSVIPERAKLIRRIFERYNKGDSINEITRSIIESGEKPWGRGKTWHYTYVQKILRNPACCGTYEACLMKEEEGPGGVIRRVRHKSLEVKDYYPKVVSTKMFLKVQAKFPVTKSNGSSAKQNPLSNICKCPKCGATMTRINKGKGTIPKLACVNNHLSRGCDQERFSLQKIVDATNHFFDQWDFQMGLLSFIKSSKEDAQKLREIDNDLREASKQPYSTALTQLMFKLMDERRKIELKQSFDIQLSPKRFNDSIRTFKSAPKPQEKNAAIRQIISKIIIHSETELSVFFRGCEEEFRMNNLVPMGRSRGIKKKPTPN